MFLIYVQEELSSLDNRFVELTSRVNENSQRFESLDERFYLGVDRLVKNINLNYTSGNKRRRVSKPLLGLYLLVHHLQGKLFLLQVIILCI